MTNREEVHVGKQTFLSFITAGTRSDRDADFDVDRLNAKVAMLLNQERGQLPHLSAEQCYVVIKTFGRMQDDHDEEVYYLLKPSIDHLRTVVANMNTWKSLMSLPRSDLLKALASCVKTEMGIKSRTFQLQGWALVAIEVSNKIYEAVEAEEVASGLSKVLVQLKHEVKKMMDNVQTLLVALMRRTQRSPSTAAVYFKPLRVGLRNGIPSYLDPDQKVVKNVSSRHPLFKTAGSEWNKWLKRHNTKFIRIDRNRNEHYVKLYVPEGPILELRQAFTTAVVMDQAIELERMLAAQPLLINQVRDPFSHSDVTRHANLAHRRTVTMQSRPADRLKRMMISNTLKTSNGISLLTSRYSITRRWIMARLGMTSSARDLIIYSTRIL